MIIKKEIHSTLKSLIIWAIVLISFAWMIAPFIDYVLNDSQSLKEFINMMPKFMLKAFTDNIDSLFTPQGFFNVKIMMMAEIFTAIFSIMTAASIFAHEFEKKTIEYILIKPINRKQLYQKKVYALFLIYLIFAMIFWISILILFKIYVHYPYDVKILSSFALYLFVTEVFFGSITAMLSVIYQRNFMPISITMGIFVFMLIGDMLGNVMESINWIRYFSIFKYISSNSTVATGKIYLFNSLIIIIISIGLIFTGQYIFEKKDISI
ncbi:hypothetical protein Marpi_1354 [Marinitoga piezophila KA3]|uniref:ABC-type transport system involved in multi-copper enzyme maturation, permease component n=1 Tax=Marinitoga piezophila (strain DSM 14283 / JCM 11233 / KA3) TaxID=443254 RepID=H2J3E1_MARPK|nr:ABC transporter permease subunit [Marinitoga piezophila]AEX85757.1 hypothetical protein Marpi_1354 [Marinitoga piezophila KA3]